MPAHMTIFAAISAALLAACPLAAAEFTPATVQPGVAGLVRSSGHSSLYAVAAEGYTDGDFFVAVLRGDTYYQHGYDYGTLLGNQSVENFEALTAHVTRNSSLVAAVLDAFLDYQFETYLTRQMPQHFLDELRGVEDAGNDAGLPKLGAYVRRGLTLSNVATGAVVFDIEYIIVHELGLGLGGAEARELAARVAGLAHDLFKRHCSMWGAWNSRTPGGGLWAGRNLDWVSQTGVSKNKVIAVYHPPAQEAPAGASPYAVIGFAGLVGALTGMSGGDTCVVTQEAGNDNKMETMEGFAWPLRLRYIMERAASLDDARSIWAATNNTLGLNHGVGFGGKQSPPDAARFMCIETKRGYSAYFLDNDPRERNSTYGEPLTDAVFRTNHGYDPTFLATARSDKPAFDTLVRYQLIHDTLEQYAAAPMTTTQAINVTAVAGDKGSVYVRSAAPFVNCSASHATGGSNVLSVTYDANPARPTAYVAVENGAGAGYVPACCGAYVEFDLTSYFTTGKPPAAA